MSALMTDMKVDPTFVVYNIVFGTRDLPYVSQGIVLRELAQVGVSMPLETVDTKLRSWTAEGKLRKRNGVYYVV